MDLTTRKQPTHRIYAVKRRAKGDPAKSDWIEVGAMFPTKTKGILSQAKNDAFDVMMKTGEYDLMLKEVSKD